MRINIKFLNLSYHFLSMNGWHGDTIFFPVEPIFKNYPYIFSQKNSSPLDFIFDTYASAFIQ